MNSNRPDRRTSMETHRLSRRQFLGTTAATALAAAAAITPSASGAPSRPERRRRGNRDRLVVIFLRGGADGLDLCVPFADPHYYTLRPTLAVPPPSPGSPNAAIPLTGFFGMHPLLAPLLPAWNAGRLAFVHATGLPNPSRSHFDKERLVEVADPNPSAGSGWLARHLSTIAPLDPSAPLRGVSLGVIPPWSMGAAPKSLPIADLATFGLAGSAASAAQRRQILGALYAMQEPLVQAAGANTLAAIDLIGQIDFNGYQPAGGAIYPSTPLGVSLKNLATLLKAQVGIEVATVDFRDWDTHGTQGVFSGTMASLVTDFATSMGAFHADLFASGDPGVTVVVMSEFGRVAAENGNHGTDHGYGGVMMLLGASVAGGQVVANWPGLAPAQLFQGQDLAITIDYRDILAEVLLDRLGTPALSTVLPGFVPTLRNVCT